MGIRSGISQRGAALLELALAAPLFLVVIYGILSVSCLARGRYQLALITHGVMREAAGGQTEGYALSQCARRYAEAAGMGREAAVVVEVSPVSLSLGGAGPDMSPRQSLLGGIFPGIYLGAQSGFQIAGIIGGRMGRAVRVTVRAAVPVGGLFRRIWPRGVPLESSFVCLPGVWQSPLELVRELVPLPAIP